MAETPSTMVPLGTKAPDFNLPDTVSGRNISLSEIKSDVATVVMFICNHCPYVKHINKSLSALAKNYKEKGVSFVAINSNDVENYPEDSPAKMKETAIAQEYSFPYLFDETQDVARDYKAACTPDLFVYDKDLKLAYRGQYDSSRPGNNKEVNGESLANALNSLIAGEPVDNKQIPGVGCNIKWKR